ncbi:MAG: metalloprotease [Desulfurococcales archaeon ex4484_217_1]|nr:MAG: metalloprotease [Desulfurococcales archaeon ex4484_217_1]
MKIIINKRNLARILSEASRRAYEICGFLLGTRKNDVLEVSEVIFINNVAGDKEKAFYMNPIKTYNALMYASKKSLEIVGIFHSHINSTLPSEEDLKYMKLWNVLWLIVDSTSKKYRAFILDNGKLNEVKVILRN